MSEHTDAAVAAAQQGAEAVSASSSEPDEALLLRLSAQKLWAEGQSSALINKAESGSTVPSRPPLSDVRDRRRFTDP